MARQRSAQRTAHDLQRRAARDTPPRLGQVRDSGHEGPQLRRVREARRGEDHHLLQQVPPHQVSHRHLACGCADARVPRQRRGIASACSETQRKRTAEKEGAQRGAFGGERLQRGDHGRQGAVHEGRARGVERRIVVHKRHVTAQSRAHARAESSVSACRRSSHPRMRTPQHARAAQVGGEAEEHGGARAQRGRAALQRRRARDVR
jgi:hypothetical protein